MRTFFILWAGQFASGVGSSLTGFALAVWAFQLSGSVSELSWIVMAATVPGLLVAPAAGALVDRWNRRTVLLLSDAVAAVGTGAMALLVYSGRLEIWHICALVAVTSASKSFQDPAFLASVPLIVSKKQLGRASGLSQLSMGLSTALAPAVGGTLVLVLGIGGVLLIDLATFTLAVISVLLVRIPRPPASEEGHRDRGVLRGEVVAGWRYLRGRPGLFRLLCVFAGVSFLVAFGSLLYVPLMLSFTTSVELGVTLSIGAIGMIVGSLIVAARGVPRKKIPASLGLMFLGGLMMALVGVRPSTPLILAATVAMMFILPIARGTDQVLWQTKVAPDIQGRVFALRRMIARGAVPLAYLICGPLADRVFEPLMAEGERFAVLFGPLIGTGPGRGIGLMFILAGLGSAALAVIGYLQPAIRNLEADVPDSLRDTEPALETEPSSI